MRSLFNHNLTVVLLAGALLVSPCSISHADDPEFPALPVGMSLLKRDNNRAAWSESLKARIPDLSPEQTLKILDFYAQTDDRLRIRLTGKSLSEAQVKSAQVQAHFELADQIAPILTEAQRAQWRRTAYMGAGGKEMSKRMAKLVTRFKLANLELSEEQTRSVLALGEAALDELEVVYNNRDLTEAQRTSAVESIYNGIYTRADALLSPAQLVKWKAAMEARRQAQLQRDYGLRPGETMEQKQARLLKPYENAISGLTPAQKARLWPIAEETSDVLEEIQNDNTRTAAQKAKITQRVRETTLKKLSTVLTKAQLAQWKAAQPK